MIRAIHCRAVPRAPAALPWIKGGFGDDDESFPDSDDLDPMRNRALLLSSSKTPKQKKKSKKKKKKKKKPKKSKQRHQGTSTTLALAEQHPPVLVHGDP
jgi:hypothetical protein